ncbi:ABC transporter ATP-binding protein [Streptococcus loxodontisalivarius]|uniref:ATP-binding cassette subfamily B protein n=1 Tax=Streptococcus loxodontisalivarius TaxID=1349415 RepID=A0ABS2PS81_9STRE|nr:ABC transporter ATP-binding protein [Streptococcus loxodontisalivarius]MBM7642899.1 ATP-binding cassette subfamily B protein [Streptococcus loxodontisalivarius]
MAKVQKEKKPSAFKQMLPYTKGFRFALLFALLAAVVSSVITVIGPDKLSEITDKITAGLQGNIDIDGVVSIASTLAVLYAIGSLFSYSQTFIFATFIQRFSQRLRSDITQKIARLPLGYFDSHSQGDTLSRVTNDVDTAGQALNQGLSTIFSSVVLLIGSIFMMFRSNVTLAFVALGTVFGGFLLTMIIMASSQPLFKKQQNNLSAVTGFAEEIYSGHNVVTSYNDIDKAKAEFKVLNDNLHSSMWKSQFFSGIMMPMMQFMGNFAYVMVIVVGAQMAVDGKITMGTIVAFMTYVRIFSQPLSQLAQAITQMQSANAAMGRVFEFLAEEEMLDESAKTKQLQDPKGQVDFQDVFFGYNPDKTIIHDFTAQAKPGQKVAIVGPTGAGKTTIVNLLMKFYEINSGKIAIDGVDIKDMTRDEVHDQFSMVLQDTWLFEGTIKENLIYNQEQITDEQVIAAAKAVGVHHFITTLPKGYDTYLDDSVTLSVGQKQLLTIARALLKEAPLLILDEATSSVDTRTEILIQEAMDKLMEGRTSFVIAHRLSTIKNADLILVMKDGNIIEQGNHEDLMSQNGFYADLYNSQFTEEVA